MPILCVRCDALVREAAKLILDQHQGLVVKRRIGEVAVADGIGDGLTHGGRVSPAPQQRNLGGLQGIRFDAEVAGPHRLDLAHGDTTR